MDYINEIKTCFNQLGNQQRQGSALKKEHMKKNDTKKENCRDPAKLS